MVRRQVRKVAIIGGIGSGKSYVCACLKQHGIEVFDCDASAKRLMRTSDTLQQALKLLVGEEVYANGVLQKKVLAQYLLQSDEHKMALNNVVHPAVADDFNASGNDWLESAIFFESGFNKRVDIDYVVCVTAPLEVRVQRVMKRDEISRDKAMAWIEMQMSQDENLSRSDYEIVNDGVRDVAEQVEKLLQTITNK